MLYGRTEDPRPHAYLDMDGELAFSNSCKYLIDQGHKRIALINRESDYMFPVFCKQGYLNGLESGGLSYDPDLLRDWRYNDPKLSSYQHTLELMKLKNPPTAILFFTQTAAGILQALQQLNLKTPDDISLICYDDLEIAKTNKPPLTVMCPQASKAGERSVGMLVEIFDGRPVEELQEIWTVEMVQRQSTGRV